MENINQTINFLVITFTLVLFILSVTIIFLFMYIQNQKRIKHLIKKEVDTP